MAKINSILHPGEIVNGYTILFYLKKSTYAESYRVRDEFGSPFYLKLTLDKEIDKSQLTNTGVLYEFEALSNITHPNIVKLIKTESLSIQNKIYLAGIYEFLSGETVEDKILREGPLNPIQASEIMLNACDAVSFLHANKPSILHNDITPKNLFLNLADNIPTTKIIDFGYSSTVGSQVHSLPWQYLDPYFLADEVFCSEASILSDIYSLGATYYSILTGSAPWHQKLVTTEVLSIEQINQLLKERSKILDRQDIDSKTFHIILKALDPNPENRHQSVQELKETIKNTQKQKYKTSPNTVPNTKKNIERGGFDAISGMEDLKSTLRTDLIDAITEKDKYQKYGLTITNGMLLYGPPGCGKTFFVECLAEEINFNLYHVHPSDIQSKYVNATQEKVKQLFIKASENQPSIIFLDELDAIVPNRSTFNLSPMNASAVNEFLAQLNNCGERGVFVIGATNRPLAIDPAILRSGRLEKHIYVPVPDLHARHSLFKSSLLKRPTELGLDYEHFANLTEGFAASDITFICNQSARVALSNDVRITQELIIKIIEESSSSITEDQLKEYEQMHHSLSTNKSSNSKPPIGF